MNKNFAKTKSLLILYFSQNKIMTFLIILLPFLFAYAVSVSNIAVLKTQEQLLKYISENQGNILLGAIDKNTMDAASVWRVRTSAAIIISILNIVLVNAHTRKDEDLGRLEIMRSKSIGILAPLLAVFIKLGIINTAGAFSMAFGFIFSGFPVVGSFTAGFAVAFCNFTFAAIAALFAQIADNAALSRGLSFGALAGFMAIQMIANAVGNDFLLLLTPLGYCAYARPYADEKFMVFIFAILIIAALTFFTFHSFNKRDLNSGLFSKSDSRLSAKKSFASEKGLAWFLQKNMFFVWLITYTMMGLIIRQLKPSINKMLDNTAFIPQLSEKLGGAGNAFISILSYILAQILVTYAIMSVLKLKEEENQFRTEILLSRAISRKKYVLSHIIIIFICSGIILAAFGITSGDFLTVISRISPVLFMVSLAFLLYGFLPRIVQNLIWTLYGFLLVLEFLWELGIIGANVYKISPFSYFYPGQDISIFAVFVLTLISAVLVFLGLISFSKRDISEH